MNEYFFVVEVDDDVEIRKEVVNLKIEILDFLEKVLFLIVRFMKFLFWNSFKRVIINLRKIVVCF